MINKKILVIYPETNSTKIAIYKNITLEFLKTKKHGVDELKKFAHLADQVEFRKKAIEEELQDNEINTKDIGVIISRGGLVKPVKSGIYEVNEIMKKDLKEGVMGVHATNLGGLIADEMAKSFPDAKAYLADPVVVDELDDIARITGHPLLERKSIFHALNQKCVTKEYARSINRKYEDLNLIAAHIGHGGVSVGAHKNGRVIDVNQAFDGNGPFSLTRAGTLPSGGMVDLCFSGKYTKEEIKTMITEKGGILAYIGTDNINEIEVKIESGDKKAELVLLAMAYQIGKEIGAMSAVLHNKVDVILLMGSLLNVNIFANQITSMVEKVAKIMIYPVVNDMDSLANKGLTILKGEAELLEYK